MKTDILEKLSGRVLLLDSAMGSSLLAEKFGSGLEAGELWNVEDGKKEKVRQIHQANVRAGSDVVITNTFGANRFKLGHYGLAGRVRELNSAGARLCREAAEGKALVAGDIGPTGEILEGSGGDRTPDEVRAGYDEQVAGLLEGGVDLFILETFMDVEELKLALEAVRAASELRVIASMTFQSGAGRLATMWGLTPEQAARELTEAGTDIVGANCGMGSEEMVQVVGRMAGSTGLPICAQPNAGLPEMVEGKTVYRETPEQMAEKAVALAAAGARLIGGCCGSTPEYIAAAKVKLGL
ncbi:MAG: homocysteine S-methyltransferase family protein [Candidatus Glassbacteria bacterium]|nr:homocysteine S-methyltransferase family protein [Candidatus Glassbacteria bacterium]